MTETEMDNIRAWCKDARDTGEYEQAVTLIEAALAPKKEAGRQRAWAMDAVGNFHEMIAPDTRPETRVEPRMDFAPLRGWIRDGPDYDQDFNGWIVYANKPDFPATPVTVTLRALTTDEEGA